MTRSRDGSSSSSVGDSGSGSDRANDELAAERHRQRILALAKPRSRARVMRGNFQKSYRYIIFLPLCLLLYTVHVH
jgi:hypothetical protein